MMRVTLLIYVAVYLIAWSFLHVIHFRVAPLRTWSREKLVAFIFDECVLATALTGMLLLLAEVGHPVKEAWRPIALLLVIAQTWRSFSRPHDAAYSRLALATLITTEMLFVVPPLGLNMAYAFGR